MRALARIREEGLARRVGRLQRQPPPARRGARARPDRGRPGGAQPVRRSRAAGRGRRALHRGRDRRDRPLAARRSEARRPAGPRSVRSPPLAGALGATPAEVALAWLLGLSPAVVAIPGARRPETARSAAAAAGAPARRRSSVPRSAAHSSRSAPARSPRARAATGRRRRRRHGHPGSGEEPDRGGARGPRLPAPEPRRARRLAARRRRRARRGAGRGRAAGRPRQHVPHPRGTKPRRRGGRAGTVPRCAASGSTRRSRRPRSTSSSASSTASARFRSPRRCASSPGVSPACSRRRRRCAPCASSSRRRRTRASRASSGGRSPARRDPRARGRARSSPQARLRREGWEDALGEARADAPHLVFDWNPDGDRAALDAATRRLAAAVSGPVEAALCPHAAGPPRCWCRPPLPGLAARVRPGARRRPVRLAARRDRARAPLAGGCARRAVRPGDVTASTVPVMTAPAEGGCSCGAVRYRLLVRAALHALLPLPELPAADR